MYAGDELYDDETTSGPIEKPSRPKYEHVPRQADLFRYIDHQARRPTIAPFTICARCARPIRRSTP
jgi:hypothetical protein